MEEIRVRKIRKSAEPRETERVCLIGRNLSVSLEEIMSAIQTILLPVRILKSGVATIVFWKDGTKTVVKCAPGIVPDDYEAFTAALAIKTFGNNSHLKKLIRRKTVVQK